MFSNNYKTLLGSTDVYDADHKSILPFFGFERGTKTESHTEKYGGNIYATRQSDNSWKLSKSAVGLYNRSRNYVTFTRTRKPTEEQAKLETEFERLLEASGKECLYCPYIEPSLSSYHRKYSVTKGTGLLWTVSIVSLFLGMFAFSGTAIFQTMRVIIMTDEMTNRFYDFMGKMDPTLAAVATAFLWILPIVLLRISGKRNKKFRATPVYALPEKSRAYVKQRWFDTMTKRFGNEMGTILQQYAQTIKDI